MPYGTKWESELPEFLTIIENSECAPIIEVGGWQVREITQHASLCPPGDILTKSIQIGLQ
jgi:hypothetical protein